MTCTLPVYDCIDMECPQHAGHARAMPAVTDADFYAQGVRDATRKIAEWLRAESARLRNEADAVPLGEVMHGGPLDGAPRYSTLVLRVRAVAAIADAIERGEHAK